MNRTPPRVWPVIGDIDAVETDNAKAMIERADALLKAQDDGLKAMETRMSSLFGQSITLASAAIAATVTSFSALSVANTSSSLSPPWVLAWVVESLGVLSAIWLAAAGVAASSMLSQAWAASGMEPGDLYSEAILTAPPNSVRLAIARALQDSIDRNSGRALRYVRRLAWVIGLLATGPLMTAVLALWLARPPWRPVAVIIVLLGCYLWLVWFLYRRATASNISTTTRSD